MTNPDAASTDAHSDAGEAKQYVEQILERDRQLKEEQPEEPAAARQRRRVRRQKIAVAVLAPITIGLTALNVVMATQPPAISLNADEVVAIQAQIARQLVEDHRGTTGAYPLSLSAVGFADPSVDYWSDGQRYTIAARVGESTAELRSSDRDGHPSIDSLIDSATRVRQ